MKRFIVVAAWFAAAALAFPLAASAQNQDFFIPGQQRAPAGPARPAQPARPPQPMPVQAPPQAQQEMGPGQEMQPPPRFQLPPAPPIPNVSRGPTPPAAILGVIGVPDVLRASTAAQQIDKAIGERREKLNEDVQKEQAVWSNMQQALNNDRSKLSPEQNRTRERELQERVTKAQRDFRERGSVIQLAAQFGLAQIERTLSIVIQMVAESRGMNMVLHRQNVALNVAEFDITDEVAKQLNQVLPSVLIPPDGVKPPVMAEGAPAPAQAAPAAAQTPPVPPVPPTPPKK